MHNKFSAAPGGKIIMRFLPALLFMALIFYFSSLPSETIKVTSAPFIANANRTVRSVPEARQLSINWLKVGHFIGYACLGLSLFYAFLPLSQKPGLVSMVVVVIYAGSDEFHQSFLPGRTASVNDVLLDTFAAACALGLISIILMMKKSLNNR